MAAKYNTDTFDRVIPVRDAQYRLVLVPDGTSRYLDVDSPEFAVLVNDHDLTNEVEVPERVTANIECVHALKAAKDWTALAAWYKATEDGEAVPPSFLFA